MTSQLARDKTRAPIHPGEILREDVLPALNTSVSQMAENLGISRQTLHRILNGSTAISPEMALRLGKFCGNGASIWLKLQQEHDLWHAEKALAASLAKIKPCQVMDSV